MHLSLLHLLLLRLHKLEDLMLAGLFLTMLLLSVWQILARNLGLPGLSWGDDMARLLVLWVGLLGAMAAARGDKHLRIDLFTRMLKPKSRRLVLSAIQLATGVISATAAYASGQYVALEFADGTTAFARVPVWLAMSVIPFSLGVIGLRYAVLAWLTVCGPCESNRR
jgi:TRAP-type C4-dicarboxylate transport system permease small subunit